MFKRLIIHPFLLCIYPIVALYSKNVYEASPIDMIGPIALGLAAAAILWGFGSLITKDRQKGAIIASVIIFLFFGTVRFIDLANVLSVRISSIWVPYYGGVPPRLIFATEVLVGLFTCYWVVRKLKTTEPLTAMLNSFALILVILPTLNIVVARPPLPSEVPTTWKPVPFAKLTEPATKPDIYYIILDSYARRDVMQALFDFDIRPFLDRLEKKGFYLAKHATANYCQTRLCLSCSLNCSYLDEMVKGQGQDQTRLAYLIGENNVVATLKPVGYKFVSFSSGFHETDHPDCDLYLSPSRLPFTGFQRLLITTTPFGPLLPMPKSLDRFESTRERVLYTLDHLSHVADDPDSTFTFAHVLSPHPPFLFGENGEDVRSRDKTQYFDEAFMYDGVTDNKRVYYRGYREQAIYITKRIEETIDRILEKSKTPPIIIVQSDHGSGMNLNMHGMDHMDHPERMSILNAYYFPGKRYEKLYDSISPVNSFRVVLNTFFGTDLKLLPDKSYYSTWEDPFRFHDVTQLVVGKEYQPDSNTADSKLPASFEPRPHQDSTAGRVATLPRRKNQ